MIERLGSDWGGFRIDTSLIPQGSTAICAGIGNDITFDLELMKRFGCKIIGLDPTNAAKSHITNMLKIGAISESNYEYIPRALWSVEEEYLECRSYRTVFGGGHEGGSKGITLAALFKTHENISLIKMDIEGSEFPVIYSVEAMPDSVRQIALEFHHRLPEVPYETSDAQACTEKLISMGFSEVEMEKDYEENLFIRR